MAKLASVSLMLASFVLVSCTAASETASRPLRQTELLALVAGNALPENIVHEITVRGLGFRPEVAYRAQLKTSGADPMVLKALDAAKNSADNSAEYQPNRELLQHLAAAGKYIKEKPYDEAAEQLTATLKGNFEKVEIGFVMGELLRQQERWTEAAAVYKEVLNEAPDFPEVHTKLSYVIHRLGDVEQALREAKMALARTPENAEAHWCLAIALSDLRKFDAALAEYSEALRIKPDYAQAHYSLGATLYEKGDKNGSVAEYRKALALTPAHVKARYGLADLLQASAGAAAAIRSFR